MAEKGQRDWRIAFFCLDQILIIWTIQKIIKTKYLNWVEVKKKEEMEAPGIEP